MLEVSLSISRKELKEKVFTLLNDYISGIDRDDGFNIGECYFNYTETEKEKSNDLKFLLSEKSIPNEFFICYEWNDAMYFLTNDNDDFSNDNMTKEEADLIDIFLMCDKDELYISKTILKDEIYDSLYIYEDNYLGHTYCDVVHLFESFSLYKLDDNSGLKDKNLRCIYAFYLLCKTRNSNFPWEESTLDEIERVIYSDSNKIPYYNIILALTSRQWRHIFLESYKMIEHLFAILFLKDVADKTDLSILNLAKTFEENLKWRPNEEEAIKRIFDTINESCNEELVYKALLNLKDEKVGEMTLYKWYYNEIRNQIAHFRVVHSSVEFSDKEWNIIIRFNFWLIDYLYNSFDEYIDVNDSK